MIKFTGHYDEKWLTRETKKHLGTLKFTAEQETAIQKLILEVAAGYQHTLDRQSWGPGWD